MRFSTTTEQKNDLDLIILKDESSKTSVAILPEYGSALHEFCVIINDKPFNIIDNYGNRAEIEAGLALSFKSSKLSPFTCRINKGKYFFEGKELEFENKFIDGSAIHGLLYNKKYLILDKSANDNEASATMKYDYNKDDAGYPFHYSCTIKYILQTGSSLRIDTTITNNSNKIIPMADGWHPYFRLGETVNNWLLQFASDSIIEFDENLIPTEKLSAYHKFNSPRLMGETQFDNCFFLKKNTKEAVCEILNPHNKLKISFFTNGSYPYLQIYTPPHRKSIAVENLSAAPDSFNNNMGLLLLEPGNSQTFTVVYQLSLG